MSRYRGFGDVFMQLAEERPVAYYPKLVKVTGSVNAAIFLSQLGYWTPKAADPDGWVYKTQLGRPGSAAGSRRPLGASSGSARS